jgi:hypothetical protein
MQAAVRPYLAGSRVDRATALSLPDIMLTNGNVGREKMRPTYAD